MDVATLKQHQMPVPGSTRRCLFGPVNHDENRQFLKELSARLDQQCSSRWNFDFKSDSPMAGRYTWEKFDSDSDSSRENSPVVAATTPATTQGGYRLRVGMRTILRNHKSSQDSNLVGEQERAEPKTPTGLPKPHSITNFEIQPASGLRRALQDFHFEVRQATAAKSTSPCEAVHAAVQCELRLSPSSSSSSQTERDDDSENSATTTIKKESESSCKSTATSCCCRKRKQSTILEYFQKKKSRTEGRRVNIAKRRLDL